MIEGGKLNSLFTWYPLIKDLVPTPKTVMIPLKGELEDLDEALCYRPTKDPAMRNLADSAIEAVHSLGGYPVFVKGDESANKHDWVESCYVTSDEQMEKGIKNMLEFTFMVMMGPDFRGVAVREFLNLDWKFHAFSGMPIAREFRFFIENGYVQCWHPYWFPACMQRVDDEDWLPKLREIQKLSFEELDLLDKYSRTISKAVEPLGAKDNYWSLDYCIDKKDVWYLTDMAYGPDSYHYATCTHAPEQMRKQYGDPEDMKKVTTLKQLKQLRIKEES